MYNNVGNKIKVLAQVVGWLCFVAGIIAWIVLLACGEQIGWAVLGSGVLALVSLWVWSDGRGYERIAYHYGREQV